MGDRTTLTALQERLEKATGPDARLDAEITAWIIGAEVRPYPPTDDFGPKDRWQFWSLDGAHFLGSESKFPVSPASGSLDAVIALVERRQLRWFISWYPKGYSAEVWAGPINSGEWVGPTKELAVLKAFVAALIVQDPNP